MASLYSCISVRKIKSLYSKDRIIVRDGIVYKRPRCSIASCDDELEETKLSTLNIRRKALSIIPIYNENGKSRGLCVYMLWVLLDEVEPYSFERDIITESF